MKSNQCSCAVLALTCLSSLGCSEDSRNFAPADRDAAAHGGNDAQGAEAADASVQLPLMSSQGGAGGLDAGGLDHPGGAGGLDAGGLDAGGLDHPGGAGGLDAGGLGGGPGPMADPEGCDQCEVGQARCAGGELSLCAEDELGCLDWSVPEACPFVCDDTTGSCTGSCVPGEQRCDDTQPQVCSDASEWVDSGDPCGDCTSCSTMSGTCVVMLGASCDDDNACTTGEECQADGECAGGSAVTCTGADQCREVGACQPATGCPAPTILSGISCDNENPCMTGETCQLNGACGGGTPVSNATSCGVSEYCDGTGGCGCRTPSSWNLLANPGFDGSASSWELLRDATYESEDADGCSGSGSALLDGLVESFQQCVPALPDRDYYFGFRFRSSAGPGIAGTAICYLAFLETGFACDEGASEIIGSDVDFETDTWVEGAGAATSPPNTATIRFYCVSVGGAGYYDQLYLSTGNPGDPPF